MSNLPRTMQIQPQALLLDPNNRRLVRSLEQDDVPDAEIPTPELQRSTRMELLSIGRYLHTNLRRSIQTFGWRQIAPLLVRQLPNGQHVLVDGNLRVAHLQQMPDLVLSSGDLTVTVVELNVVDDISLGIHHILPTQVWSRLASALWRERHGTILENRASTQFLLRFGRTGRMSSDEEITALELCRAYLENSVDTEDPNEVFDVIVELLRSRAFSAWLKFGNNPSAKERALRVLNWISPREFEERANEDASSLLSDPNRGSSLRARVSQAGGFNAFDYVFRDARLTNLVEQGESPFHLYQAREINRDLGVWADSLSDQPWPIIDPSSTVPLQSLYIERYRGLEDLHIDNLSTINLFVGINNAGKTSILEAIHLLSHMSDPRGVVDILQARVRHRLDQNPKLLGELLLDIAVKLSAVGKDGRQVAVSFRSNTTPPPDTDLATFVTQLFIDAKMGEVEQQSVSIIHSNLPRMTKLSQGSPTWFATSVLHSPFAAADSQQRAKWYEETTKSNTLGDIISLIQRIIDPDIKDIRLVGDSGRFLVEHNRRQVMDLSSYGEGLQRFFEIGLLFSVHRNGFVLIDEFETAIHTSALPGLANMITQLANQFNVQVFITTHSNETIDAFTKNEQATSTVAFGLYRQDSAITVRRYAGPSLGRVRKATGIDIRRQ